MEKQKTTYFSNPGFKRKRAFSIMEIVIVIAIIGMLVAVVVQQLGNVFEGQSKKLAKQFVTSSVKLGLTRYKMDMRNYPSTAEGLQALLKAPSGAKRWKGPYFGDEGAGMEIFDDPWGKPYQYKFPGTKRPKSYDCFSFGPDGVPSDDDIGNWDE